MKVGTKVTVKRPIRCFCVGDQGRIIEIRDPIIKDQDNYKIRLATGETQWLCRNEFKVNV